MTSVPAMRDERAREILTQFCNPKKYANDEEMMATLFKGFPQEILASLRVFLGSLIDNDNLSSSEKVKRYFGLTINKDEDAEEFIDAIYCDLSEHLFPDEEA
jgi:hypothetical protein